MAGVIAPGHSCNGKSPMKISIIPLVLTIFAASPMAEAVSPAPDGGYPKGNTAEGQKALFSLTTGTFNTGVGFLGLESNTTGSFNTALGAGALLANTAEQNTATGAGALLSTTTGFRNTANGAFALFKNTTGFQNTAVGESALFSNTAGSANTAAGGKALFNNTIGASNTAHGAFALFSNTTGVDNTAIGDRALNRNNEGSFNTATGAGALISNTTSSGNTATGEFALAGNTTGSDNIALGFEAGFNLTTGNFNIDIGNRGFAGEASTIRMGTVGIHSTTFIAGISVATVIGNPVVVNDDGQLGVAPSSRRFKKEIKPMNNASESILALKPVTFHYKNDVKSIPQFGLIAEEVAEVNPDLVVRDEKGEIYTVRYDAVNAMLLNEFLKEHKKVDAQQSKTDQQQATIAELKSIVAQQQKNFEATAAQQKKEIQALAASLIEQASQIQKVSARVEINRPATDVALNSP